MQYKTCSGDLYEVRWNVMTVDNRLSLLTVSSRQLAAKGSPAAILFSNPATLRTLIED
jgi:hypothetical protein